MVCLPCRPRSRVSYRFVLAAVASVAGAPTISGADGPMPDAATLQATERAALRGVLTREQQAAHTPQTVLDNLLAGNRRFVANDLTQRNHSQRIPAYVAHVCRENVRLAVETIRERSEILRTMEADGSLKIVGAYYDLRSGEVTPLPRRVPGPPLVAARTGTAGETGSGEGLGQKL